MNEPVLSEEVFWGLEHSRNLGTAFCPLSALPTFQDKGLLFAQGAMDGHGGLHSSRFSK